MKSQRVSEMTIESWKYDDFVKANGGKFSALDFIHAVSEKVALPWDFVLCMGHLFAPQMAMFDGVVVIVEWFDEERYQEYRSTGMNPEQAQAWTNMVELTDIFQGISFDKAKELALFIAALWSERISQIFLANRPGRALFRMRIWTKSLSQLDDSLTHLVHRDEAPLTGSDWGMCPVMRR